MHTTAVQFADFSAASRFARPHGEAIARDEASFDATLAQAKRNLTQLAEKLVASAFVLPMIGQMRNDPLKSDLFHGGFAEDVFTQQYDTRLADTIAANGKFPVVDLLAERFGQWLEYNPQRVHHAAQLRIDTLG